MTDDEYDEATAHWTSREAAASRMPEDELRASALPKLRGMLHLIRVVPTRIDLLCSDLKSRGCDSRQWLEL